MSGYAVSNKLVKNRLLFCLSMLLLAAALVLAPAAEAQDPLNFGEEVRDQRLKAGEEVSLELPEASGGNEPRTYDVRPPAFLEELGLTFNSDTRMLEGELPDDLVIGYLKEAHFIMTYEATDADGATATLTFNIIVEEKDVDPSFETVVETRYRYLANEPMSLELPTASGSGNGPLTYRLSPEVPGLTFDHDPDTRTLSGTPSEVAIFAMTYEVADADGDTATLTFTIEVDTKPSFNGSVADQQYETGKAIGTLQLPDATVGDREEPPVYSLSGINEYGESEMPPGLTFDDQALTLSGTPTKSGTYTLTYRVVDSDTNMGPSDETTLTFTVDVQLTFAEAFENQIFSEGDEIKLMLPAALATDDRLEYSLKGEPRIPPDLTFDSDPEARTLSGELPTLSDDDFYAEIYELTYTVKVREDDNDLNKAEFYFTIVVDGKPSFGDRKAPVPEEPYQAGDTGTMSLELPKAFSGNVGLTYSLELPEDLSGLKFEVEGEGEGETRTLSGDLPTKPLSANERYAADYDLTLLVEDADGDVAELPFTIVVDSEPSFGDRKAPVPEESYQTGEEMSLTLPEPTGGNVIWEYRLEGKLPEGLEFNDDPAIRTISGTPPPNVLYDKEYNLTLEVWDADGDVDRLDFTIVVDGMPDFGDDKTVDAKPSYPAGEAMSLTLPDADGGNVKLTYRLEHDGNWPPELPELRFLHFDDATRTLSGMPSAYRKYAESYVFTLIVVDEDADGNHDSAELDFTIVVDGMPSFVGRDQDDLSYDAGVAIDPPLELPEAVGGNVELMYHLNEEDLPESLDFDPATRTISGTPPADSLYAYINEPHRLTYWATDADGDKSELLTFTIVVYGEPEFNGDIVMPAAPYPAGELMSLTLPDASGGNVDLTYSLNEENLPPGLVFDAEKREISGTPPKYASYAADGYALTYRVEDFDGSHEEKTFTLRVNGQPRFDESVAETVAFTEGQDIAFVLPSASGGNGQLTYELVGELPNVLSFDPATRTISGFLSADELYAVEETGYTVTYTVTDEDGEGPADPDPASLTFKIVVHGMPSFVGQSVDDQRYVVAPAEDLPVTLELPAADDSNGRLTYHLEGTLPDGLDFNAATHTIEGTLSAASLYGDEWDGYALTYWATDDDGDESESLTFTIRVNGQPSFDSDVAVPAAPYPAGEEIPRLVLPSASGGNVALTYSLNEEDLPPGLVFDAETREISGTPPKYASYAAEGYALTYRVADADELDDEPDALVFTLRVNGQPRFDVDPTVELESTFKLAEGEDVDWVLPSASGGNGQLTYHLNAENLPEGLSFDPATRTISGFLSAEFLYAVEETGYTVTYTVTDEDGEGPADPDPASLTFKIVVHGMPSFVGQSVDDQRYVVAPAEDLPVTLELPAADDSNGGLTYHLEGTLPEGLRFYPETHTIEGTLSAASLYGDEWDGYALTYWATDADGDESDPLTFTIRVNGQPSFDSDVAVPAAPYPAGEEIPRLVLPSASGGNVALTYSLNEEDLPPGLVFDAETREISGTPPKYASYAAEGYALTYRVADADELDDEPDALVFTLRVNGQPRFDVDPTVELESTFKLAEGEDVDWVLPSASGGNGQLTYHLNAENLPEGLSFDPATRTISGFLSAEFLYAVEETGYTVTYTVTDEDGEGPADPDPASLTFKIVVHGMPSFVGQSVDDQRYVVAPAEDLPVTLELPAADDSNGGLTYHLEGTLPEGLDFNAATHTIEGTLSAASLYGDERDGYALTYWATDADGDESDPLTFTIRVNGQPSFDEYDASVLDMSYEAGAAIAPLVLPSASGGNVALTYSLDAERLPPGLTFDAATRTISGMLDAAVSYTAVDVGYTLTYGVADADGDEPDPLTVMLRVNGQPRFDEGVSEQITFAEGQTIDPFVLPSASGGNGQLTYELVGELPEGLNFDPVDRKISGTLEADATYKQAESEGYMLEYRVMDAEEEEPTEEPTRLTFTIVVHGMPRFVSTQADLSYTAGDAIDPVVLPAAAGGNGDLTYSLNEEGLPEGLNFDPVARTISGTPPADYLYVAEGYALTYQVADVDGDAVTLRFTIAVNGIPSFGDQVVEDQSYEAGTGNVETLELPEAVGGNVALTYFLDGDLPPGLAFNPTSRTISGELSPNVSYSPEGYTLTYRVADVDGEEAAPPLTFTISVNGMPFFEGTITNQQIPEGEEMAPLELPAALGGNGALTYSLNEEGLPPGLVFDPVARTISGTPELNVSHPAEGYALTYRVEDEDGDPAELSFVLTVDGTPTFFDATIEDRILRQNEAMDPWEFPAAAGGNGDLTYTLDMNVPGLSFDAVARTLSGTPTHTGVYRLIYQVEDIDGDAAELSFHITVDGAPSFSGDVANQTYIDGEAIEDLVLPLASGGNLLSLNPDGEAVFGELTYTLDNVPPGLTFDPNPMSPMLSGTPTGVGTYTLTYTAHDSDDNMTAEDAAILSFEVRVEESATDRFAELNEQILSKYALAIADGTNRAIENRLEHMDRVGDENRSFRFAAESTLHNMIQSGRIFENRPVNMSQVVNGSSFAVPFGFGRGCILCPGSPTFWGRGDYGQMSSDDGSLDWDGNLTRAQIGLDARPGAEMLTGLALSWAQGAFDYTAPLHGEERVDGTYETRMLSLHPYVGFSPGRLGVWLTAGLGRGNLDIDDAQGTIGQQASDTSLRTASVGASGDLLASGPTQVRVKAAATVAQVEVEGGALNVAEGGNRIAEQTVSANRLRLALKGSHAYEVGTDGQMTPQLEVALRQDGGDGQTGAGVEVGGGLRYDGGGFTLEAMARSLVSDGDDAVEYKEWGMHLLLQRSTGTGGRGLSLRVMPTYGTQANSLTLWERSVAEIADRGAVNAQGQLRAEVGYGLAALGGRGLYTVYSGMAQASERLQLRLGTRFEVDSSLSVSLESTRSQRMTSAADHGLLLRGRLVF